MCVSSLIINLTGCLLIYFGVRAEGSIDFKTAFLEGRLETGMVGLVVVVIGMIISLAVLRTQKATGRTIEIDLPDGRKIYLKGVNSMRDTIGVLQPIVAPQSVKSQAKPRLNP
jgi:hypothetical protein